MTVICFLDLTSIYLSQSKSFFLRPPFFSPFVHLYILSYLISSYPSPFSMRMPLPLRRPSPAMRLKNLARTSVRARSVRPFRRLPINSARRVSDPDPETRCVKMGSWCTGYLGGSYTRIPFLSMQIILQPHFISFSLLSFGYGFSGR